MNDDYLTIIGNIYFAYLAGFQDGQASKAADAREKTREFISLYLKSKEDTMMTCCSSGESAASNEDIEFLRKHTKQMKY